jgi:glycolate oxidase iron-sulfur subunit
MDTRLNTLNCIRCGLCLSVCPTYREFLSETASPRGRVALARKGMEGELALSPNLAEQMYACYACMACNAACPVGIRPADLALEMRRQQETQRPAGWKQALFGGLLPRPARLELATLPLRLYQLLGVRRLVYALGLRRLLPARLRDLEAMLPHLPQRPLRSTLPEVVEANHRDTGKDNAVTTNLVEGPVIAARALSARRSNPPDTLEGCFVAKNAPRSDISQQNSKYRVGFFLGCAQSLLFAEQSAASVRVLARNGCTVITPKSVQCCGMPALGYGRPDLAQAQARHNIALFEQVQVDVIVTDCATCGSMLKEYAHLLGNDPEWAGRAAGFSARTRDISEFLAEIPLEKPAGRVEARVTYHDPCHLRRAQGVWKQPRALLQMIDGLEFVEMPEADWCCGSAGSQLITHYATSLKTLDRKLDNLASAKAEIVVSGCPGCQMQLNVGVRRRGLAVQVTHPIELLDRAYSENS